MQTNILWTGREYHSLENCLVNTTPSGADIASTIVGYYEGKIYKVDYRIKTSARWETVLLEIQSRHSDRHQSIRLEGDGRGAWMLDGRSALQFDGCLDVDIPLTPFTNTLPIRRLGLRVGETRENRRHLLRRSGRADKARPSALHPHLRHGVSLRECAERF